MKLITLAAAFSTFLATTAAASIESRALKNSSQEYYLKTDLKPGQKGKERFNGLWIVDYHTGAGLGDAVAIESKKGAAKGFLNGTVGESGDVTYQNQIFDRGNPFPWTMIPEPFTVFYTAWQPVRIDAGDAPSGGAQDGFWINDTGLQWTADVKAKPDSVSNPFQGWLVCDWWHGVPQLFFRVNQYPEDVPAPSSCADVWLCPEYI